MCTRGELVPSSVYAYEDQGGGRRGLVWDSGYAESFSEGDLGVGASARGVGDYGKFIPPPLPIVGMPGVGGWSRAVRFVQSARSGSSMYVWARGVNHNDS